VSSRVARIASKTLDGMQYALLATGVAVATGGPASVLLTGDVVPLKWFLFLAGLLAALAGALKLRPESAWADRQRPVLANGYADSGYGGLVRRLPPVAWLDYDRGEHLSDGGRLFVLGAVALGTSFALEAALGVGVPPVS
jgi:hypothetical protein